MLAYDPQTTKVALKAIDAVLVHLDFQLEDLTIDGETLHTTPNHPFYTQDKGWVAAGNLIIGEEILKADGSYGKVQTVWVSDRAQLMYNLTVHDDHDYFVGNGQWLVHNANICLFSQGRISRTFTTQAIDARVPNEIAGKDLRDVAALLRDGKIDPDLLYVQYFEQGGQSIAINNRALATWSIAELQPSQLIYVPEEEVSAAIGRRLGQTINLPRPQFAAFPRSFTSPSDLVAITEGKSGSALENIFYVVKSLVNVP